MGGISYCKLRSASFIVCWRATACLVWLRFPGGHFCHVDGNSCNLHTRGIDESRLHVPEETAKSSVSRPLARGVGGLLSYLIPVPSHLRPHIEYGNTELVLTSCDTTRCNFQNVCCIWPCVASIHQAWNQIHNQLLAELRGHMPWILPYCMISGGCVW